MSALKGFPVGVLLDEGFDALQLDRCYVALREAGANVRLLAPTLAPVRPPGRLGFERGERRYPDLPIDIILPIELKALVIPGGLHSCETLRRHPGVRKLLVDLQKAWVPIAALGHGPWLLAAAGLVDGRALTSAPAIQADLENAGAVWVDTEVVRDYNWVTARGTAELSPFIREMLLLFEEATRRIDEQGPMIDEQTRAMLSKSRIA